MEGVVRGLRKVSGDAVSDVELALTKLRGIVGEDSPDRLVMFTHEGAPISKSRARWAFKTGRFYTPTKTAQAEASLSAEFQRALRGEPLTGSVAIVAVFYRPNFQRIDADNLMKLVMDAGTKARAWQDDSQVTAQASFLEYDPVRPRTVIALCPATSTLSRERMRGFTCERCRKPFERDRFQSGKRVYRFCSTICARAAERSLVKCPKCSKVFPRRRAKQVYCSHACALAVTRQRRLLNLQPPPSRCHTCGGPVSRREYVRCALCAPKGRKLGAKNRPKHVPEHVPETFHLESER